MSKPTGGYLVAEVIFWIGLGTGCVSGSSLGVWLADGVPFLSPFYALIGIVYALLLAVMSDSICNHLRRKDHS